MLRVALLPTLTDIVCVILFSNVLSLSTAIASQITSQQYTSVHKHEEKKPTVTYNSKSDAAD